MAKPFAMRRRKGLLQRVSTMKAPITATPRMPDIRAGGAFRLSKNLAEDVRDRAAGGVCGGQKAHRAFNQQDFETF